MKINPESKRTQAQVLTELIHAIGQASGSAWQIVHLQQDPRFIMIREALDLMKEGCLMLAPQGLKEKPKESTKTILV